MDFAFIAQQKISLIERKIRQILDLKFLGRYEDHYYYDLIHLYIMIKIGLLSDTHGYLDPKIFEHFRDCDELWHAGDLGTPGLADALENFKPLRAVYGNIDDINLQTRYPEDQFFTCEHVKVWMTHIGGVPPKYNPRIKKMLKENIPHLFICGHSHILRIKKDASHNNMLYLNPGAAGNQGFHAMKTIVRFDVHQDKIENMEVIELGKRGEIK